MGIVWPVKINFLLLKGRFGFFLKTIKNMLLFVGLKFNLECHFSLKLACFTIIIMIYYFFVI